MLDLILIWAKWIFTWATVFGVCLLAGTKVEKRWAPFWVTVGLFVATVILWQVAK